MPMQDFCRNCDKELDYTIRVDSKFCSESCRMDFHNTHKKVTRAHARVVEAIAYLRDVLHAPGEEPAAVLKLLEDIASQTKTATDDVSWKCRHCGQRLFVRPVAGQRCDFCHQDKWATIIPKKRD